MFFEYYWMSINLLPNLVPKLDLHLESIEEMVLFILLIPKL